MAKFESCPKEISFYRFRFLATVVDLISLRQDSNLAIQQDNVVMYHFTTKTVVIITDWRYFFALLEMIGLLILMV